MNQSVLTIGTSLCETYLCFVRHTTLTKRVGLSSKGLVFLLLYVHTPKLQMADFDHAGTEGCDLP